jgi:hypothetical protein
MKTNAVQELQRETCKKFDAEYLASFENQKIGIASNVNKTALILNGLRHQPTNETTGWYIWAGEVLSNEPSFFSPIHVSHVDEYCPVVKKYLGLAPGWRFLIAENYVDVWYDKTVADIS